MYVPLACSYCGSSDKECLAGCKCSKCLDPAGYDDWQWNYPEEKAAWLDRMGADGNAWLEWFRDQQNARIAEIEAQERQERQIETFLRTAPDWLLDELANPDGSIDTQTIIEKVDLESIDIDERFR